MNAYQSHYLRQNVRRLPALLVATALLAGSFQQARAQDSRFATMQQGMTALADQIRRELSAEGLDSVNIRSFTPAAQQDGGSFGPRIVTALKAQLEADAKLRVGPSGSWSVSGEYTGEMNKAAGKFEIYIQSTLKDRLGRTKARLMTPIITDEQEALSMLGASVSLPLAAPATAAGVLAPSLGEVRAQAIADSRANPQVAIANALVKTTQASPYGMEVLVGGQPVSATAQNGQAFVPLSFGQSYFVRLINNSDEDVGVALTIDGINSLAFSRNPNYKQFGMWVIPRRSQGVVRGWHDVGTRSHAFTVTELGNAPAAQLGASEKIGTITATFCAAFLDNPPPGEPPPGPKGFATGKGPPIDQPITELPRQFGVVREAISVRYTK